MQKWSVQERICYQLHVEATETVIVSFVQKVPDTFKVISKRCWLGSVA